MLQTGSTICRWRKTLAGVCLLALLAGCATSPELDVARQQSSAGEHHLALQTLAAADVAPRDRLLLYFDRGLIAQLAGEYWQSIEALEAATELLDELDYLSVGDTGSAILVNDGAARYRGEYSERLWINTVQMMNFLLAGDPSGAAVEARRAIAVFDEHADVLDADLFTRALMAMSFEAAGQQGSADVEWRRLADDGYERAEAPDSTHGQLVLFVHSGHMPAKISNHLLISSTEQIAFPSYAPNYARLPRIRLEPLSEQEDGTPIDLPLEIWQTALDDVARASLDKRGKAVIALQVARTVSKHAISDQIGEENELAGEVARLLFFALEYADTRSWETLPASLSLVTVTLPPGQHRLLLDIDGDDRTGSDVHAAPLDVTIAPGQRTYQLIGPGWRRQDRAEALAPPAL